MDAAGGHMDHPSYAALRVPEAGLTVAIAKGGLARDSSQETTPFFFLLPLMLICENEDAL